MAGVVFLCYDAEGLDPLLALLIPDTKYFICALFVFLRLRVVFRLVSIPFCRHILGVVCCCVWLFLGECGYAMKRGY